MESLGGPQLWKLGSGQQGADGVWHPTELTRAEQEQPRQPTEPSGDDPDVTVRTPSCAMMPLLQMCEFGFTVANFPRCTPLRSEDRFGVSKSG